MVLNAYVTILHSIFGFLLEHAVYFNRQDFTSLDRLLLQGLAQSHRRDRRRLRLLLLLGRMVGILPRVLLQLGMELGEHEVGDVDVGPVRRVRGHSRYVCVARLAEHVVHAVGETLSVRQPNLLERSRNKVLSIFYQILQ